MRTLIQSGIRRSKPLKTGQTTSYGSGTGVDDGAYEKGVAKSYTVLTTDQFAGTTDITINAKTDVHSNNCVLDNNTGLMWSRYSSASVGPASDGKLPWTTTGAGATAEGIFDYCAAANVAALSGYSDWRVPNISEFLTILDLEAVNANPDSTAFPSDPNATHWQSTTRPSGTTTALDLSSYSAAMGAGTKTGTAYVRLVRGG